jgi:hypothetical protein
MHVGRNFSSQNLSRCLTKSRHFCPKEDTLRNFTTNSFCGVTENDHVSPSHIIDAIAFQNFLTGLRKSKENFSQNGPR